MSKRKTIFCLTIACLLAFAGGVVAEETDYSSTITGPEGPVAPGTVGTFEIEVANAGPDTSPFQVILDMHFPLDAPFAYMDYLQADEDGRTAMIDSFLENVFYDENIWDSEAEDSGLFFGPDSYCNAPYMQFQGITLGAGESGKIYYDTTLPEVGVSGFAYVKSDGEKVVLDDHIGNGACSSTFDDCYVEGVGTTCMGPRVTMYPASGAPITLVDDGNAAPPDGSVSDACESFVGQFPEGHVALVDRGKCAFQDKVKNASDAGATGVIIANYEGGGDWGNDGVGGLSCNNDATCNELLITAPVVFISYNDGVALKAAMDAGEVAGFVGVRQEEPNYAVNSTLIWEWDSEAGAPADETDTNPDNDAYTFQTVFGEPEPPPCTPIYIAAAASGAGANNSMWSTDLGINNSGDEPLTYKFQFLPRGADNTDVAFTDEFTVQPNTNANFVDIWQSYTGGDGAGAINVCVSDPAAAGVISRTYNTSDAGTFGQTIIGMEGMAPEKLIGKDEKVRMGFLSQNAAFRTNIGFMSAVGTAITINVEFFSADGTSLGTASIDLPPYSNNQWTRAFQQVTMDDVDLGYVDVWSITEGAQFLTYASVVDNNTGDPTTIWPFDTMEAIGGGGFDCTPVWIAAAASAGGANNTVWATDLGINNLSGDPLTYRFQFLPRGADNTAVEMSDPFTLEGNGSIAYRDVWSMTGSQGAGAINVCVDNGDAAGILSRTFNTGDEGTFGQMIEGMRGAAPAKVSTGEKVRLGYLFENDAYRTNIGFMNAGANEITITAEFFDMQGNSLGTKGVTLAPYSNTQWNQAYTLAPINASGVTAGFVDVWSDTADANFLTYASIVDNGTGDPTTVWPF